MRTRLGVFLALSCLLLPGICLAQAAPVRPQTIEDFYDHESGEKFQGALGFLVQESSPSNPSIQSYGMGFDDMVIEWSESHPVQQGGGLGCGSGLCSGGARAGKLCFNTDDCGAGGSCTGTSKSCVGGTNNQGACTTNAQCTGGGVCTQALASCAAISWGSNTLYSGSGAVSLDVVDFNAESTQGTFDCTKYGFLGSTCGPNGTTPCTASNDCDNDGLKEVEVSILSNGEPQAESARLEQVASHSSDYATIVSFSSALSSPNDGIIFMQYNGTAAPSATAQYFDKDSGQDDVNGDGTPDSPPSNGRDKCPGFCAVDDNKNATGPDKRPGIAIVDDDKNGRCDFKATNAGAFCVQNSNCPGGSCLNLDEPDELCGRICTGGTGLCFGGTNAGNSCTLDANCTGGGTCSHANCSTNADCPGGGTCPAGKCYNGSNNGASCNTLADCTAGAVGGFCGALVPFGDDNCSLVDEPAEQCALVAGRLPSGIDDNCGCASNPRTAVLNAAFDVADLIVQGYTFSDLAPGDNDGFADDNELISLSLTLRNVGTLDIENVGVRITSGNANIACVNDATASYGRINFGQSASNGSDPLQFTVGVVNRVLVTDIKQGILNISVTGSIIEEDGSKTPVFGTSTPQSITFDLDLDSSGAPPVATTTKIFSFESSQYANSAAWDADWVHTNFLDHDGLHCQYNDPSGARAGSAPIGCFLRQDSGTAVPDDWHLHGPQPGGNAPDGGRDSGTPGTCVGGRTPGGACSQTTDCVGGCTNGHCVGGSNPGASCTVASHCTGGGTCNLTPGPGGSSNCLVSADCGGTCSNDLLITCTASSPDCRFCLNDHRLHCVNAMQCIPVGGSCSTQGTCNNIGACLNPAPGSACSGTGNACLHMGFHTGVVQGDTTHLDNIFYTYPRNTIQLGLARTGIDDPPILDFWQQVAITDDRIVNVDQPECLDAAVVHVLVDRNADGIQQIGPQTDSTKDGFWEKIKPYYGVPQQQRPNRVNNCTYDPDDDGNNEDDLDDDPAPNGRAKGPSSTCFPEFVWACVGDTQDPPYDSDLNQYPPTPICFPETDASGTPVVRQGAGPGRWVEAKFDLSKFKGRKIWFRFLESSVQFGFNIWTTGFGGDLGGNNDDGWYIDDIRISGTTPTPITLGPDIDPPGISSCPPVLCSGLTARLTGATYEVRHDGVDGDGDGTVDEVDETQAGTVHSDAPLRNVELNGANNGAGASGTTTGTCVNGVLQYRFWSDSNGDGTLNGGELIRDFNENPRATAAPVATTAINMDVRCSSAPALCSSTASLNVTVPGVLAPFSDLMIVPDAPLTVNGVRTLTQGHTMIWGAQPGFSAYQVAYYRETSTQFAHDFRLFHGPSSFVTTCASACGLSALDYDIDCKGNPPVAECDYWVVRGVGGSWDEVGQTNPEAPKVRAHINPDCP